MIIAFEVLQKKAQEGTITSTQSSDSIIKTANSLSSVRQQMSSMVNDVQGANLDIGIIEESIKGYAEDLSFLIEDMQTSAEELDVDSATTFSEYAEEIAYIKDAVDERGLVAIESARKRVAKFKNTTENNNKIIEGVSVSLENDSRSIATVSRLNGEMNQSANSFQNQIIRYKEDVVQIMSFLGVACLAIMFFILWLVIKPLNSSINIAEGIAAGNLSQNIRVRRKDEFGKLLNAMKVMMESLAKNLQEQQQTFDKIKVKAEESYRIKMALDVCNTNVMLVNEQGGLLYHNQSFEEMWLFSSRLINQFNDQDLVCEQVAGSITHFIVDQQIVAKLLSGIETSSRYEIAEQVFDLSATPVKNEEGRLLGTVLEWNNRTEELKAKLDNSRRAAENARVCQALDNSSTGALMTDKQGVVIYANHTLRAFFANWETLTLHNFNKERLIGESIAELHSQFMITDNLATTKQFEETLMGKTLAVIVTAIIKDNGHIGNVIEIKDRTEEVKVETEIDNLIEAAAKGNFEQRFDERGKTDFFLTICQKLNGLLENTQSGIDEVLYVIHCLSQGDLSQKLEKDYEGLMQTLKENCNSTVDKLRETIAGVSGEADQVVQNSNIVASKNNQILDRTLSQAREVEQTTQTMQEMRGMVLTNTHNAENAAQLAMETRKIADAGGEIIKQTVVSMQSIDQSSEKIVNIIGVVNEIAFQTNLLALNAAVEAARAGEQGRGFAVVANEVRSLAQKSSKAAEEIQTLINDSRQKVIEGAELVTKSGNSLADIIKSVDQVGQMIEEIVLSAKDQSTIISQISETFDALDIVTQENSLVVEETSQVSEAMKTNANEMKRLLRFFSV